MPPNTGALHVGVAALLVLISFWTLRRLWRRSRDRYTRVVYLFGVKGFGVVLFTAHVIERLLKDPSYFAGASFLDLLIDLLSSMALTLWFGFLWGRAMAWAFGLRPDDAGAA